MPTTEDLNRIARYADSHGCTVACRVDATTGVVLIPIPYRVCETGEIGIDWSEASTMAQARQILGY